MMSVDPALHSLEENFDDFFEHSLSGYIIAAADGLIIRANMVLANWLNCVPTDLVGKKIQQLLTIGGRIYYETHLSPLLRMQGHFEEIALELSRAPQEKMPILLNGIEKRDDKGNVKFVRFTIIKATDRRLYEENLKEEKASLALSLANAEHVTALRDQLIAILGHDLRNPLGSVIAAAKLLQRSALPANEKKMVDIIDRSSTRMNELIGNIMDFARTRLGEGIVVNRQLTNLEPVLQHVIDELRTVYAGRNLVTEFAIDRPVFCDGPRIAQLLSNLVANAITHGDAESPVQITCTFEEKIFSMAVCNQGRKIPEDQLPGLFEPFTREKHSSSQNGLGLGLYIAAQIARAHKGEIGVSSTEKETCFTLKINGEAKKNV